MATLTEDIKSALLEILSPKEDKKVKKEPKYVLVVNGSVLQSRPTCKSELTDAVIAIKLKNPSAKVFAYKLQGELKLDLPVSGIVSDESTTTNQGE